MYGVVPCSHFADVKCSIGRSYPRDCNGCAAYVPVADLKKDVMRKWAEGIGIEALLRTDEDGQENDCGYF